MLRLLFEIKNEIGLRAGISSGKKAATATSCIGVHMLCFGIIHLESILAEGIQITFYHLNYKIDIKISLCYKYIKNKIHFQLGQNLNLSWKQIQMINLPRSADPNLL